MRLSIRCIRKAARMLDLVRIAHYKSPGPWVIWTFKAVGDVSFILEFRFPPPQTFYK